MSALLIMDRTGHTEFKFDPKDSPAVDEAMEKFEALIKEGYRGAVRTAPGESRLMRTGEAFDPTADTLLIPHLVGG